MKFIVISAGLMLGLTACDAKAQVTPWIGVGGGVGVSSTELNADGSAIDLAQQGALAGISGGIDWKAQAISVGIMGRYSLMKLKGNLDEVKLESEGLWEVAFKFGVRPNDKVDLYALVGWSGVDLDLSGFGGSHPNGLMLGGGLEFALAGPWAGRLEYTWHDFRRDNFNFEEASGFTRTDLHVVRAELVYRFNQQASVFEVPTTTRRCDPKMANCR